MGPQEPSGGGEQHHIDPEPCLPGAHARGEEDIAGRQTERQIQRGRRQTRPIPEGPQDIVRQPAGRPQQEQPPRLIQLYSDGQFHQRRSRDRRPEAVRSSS